MAGPGLVLRHPAARFLHGLPGTDRDRRSQADCWRERLHATVSAVLWIGAGSAGFAAIGIVPRIYYNSFTNLAGGNYEGDLAYAADNGGWQAGQTVFRHFDQNTYYMGGIVIALATMALLLARFRKTSRVLSRWLWLVAFFFPPPAETPVHRVLYIVLPRFEEFHGHWPETTGVGVVHRHRDAGRNRSRFAAGMARGRHAISCDCR